MAEILRRILRMDLLLAAGLVLVGGWFAWARAGESSPHLVISDDLEPLRSAFNSEPKNVRAILLASPT